VCLPYHVPARIKLRNTTSTRLVYRIPYFTTLGELIRDKFYIPLHCSFCRASSTEVCVTGVVCYCQHLCERNVGTAGRLAREDLQLNRDAEGVDPWNFFPLPQYIFYIVNRFVGLLASSCLYVPMEQLGFHWADFHEI
jgi:hypothetical protein